MEHAAGRWQWPRRAPPEVDEEDVAEITGKGEASKFLAMVAHTLTRGGSPGNVALLHAAGAIGHCSYRYDSNLVRRHPTEYVATTFAAKVSPYSKKGRCGDLVPNPAFVSETARAAGIVHAMDLGTASLRKEAGRHPWENRSDLVFWRGKLRIANKTCDVEFGNFARFEAMTLTLRHPEQFDVKSSFPDEVPARWRNATWLHQSGCIDTTEVYGGKGRFKRVVWRIDEAVDRKKHFEKEDYARYKLLLNLPGGTSGFYSKNLNHLWATGGVVLQWNMTAREHYFAGLADGVSHAVVDVTTAETVAERILGNATLSAALREGAAAVSRDLVCPHCLTDYISETLRALREHFRGDLALDSRAALRRSLVGVNCTRLGLTEVRLDPHHGLRVVVKPLPPARTRPRAGEDAVCLALVDEAFPPPPTGAPSRVGASGSLHAIGHLRLGAPLPLPDAAPGLTSCRMVF